MKNMKAFNTIDEYIAAYPKEIQGKLKELRKAIRSVVPKAEEKICYGLPTFTLYGNLVHFGAFQKHLSFFPGASGVKKFEKELKGFETSKGTIQLPFDKKLPIPLIKKIVTFRAVEDTEHFMSKPEKTCRRGHKYRGNGCPICWKGNR